VVDTLKYLIGLFDVETYKAEKKIPSISDEDLFKEIKGHIEQLIEKNKYYRVDLGELFKFMTINQTAI